MLLTRRAMAAGVFASAAVPIVAHAAPRTSSVRPRFRNDGYFHWANPGADPYHGTFDQALEIYGRRGVPPDVLQEFHHLWSQQIFSVAPIRPQEEYDFMLSGAGVVLERVIAETEYWGSASRFMRVYVVVRSGVRDELGDPDPCHNFTLRRRAFVVQMECLPCPPEGCR